MITYVMTIWFTLKMLETHTIEAEMFYVVISF